MWSLGSGSGLSTLILRDGTNDNGGRGSQILYYQNAVYVFGDANLWYVWSDSSGWSIFGPTDPSTMPGTIFYVATSGGDDSRSCATAMSISTPKATITSGITCLTPGTTLLVRTGTYDEAIGSVPSGTSWGNKVRIAAYPGETVWLTPSMQGETFGGLVINLGAGYYVEFDGINVDASNVYGGSIIGIGNGSSTSQEDINHIRFQNLTVTTGVDHTGGSGNITVISGNNEFLNLTIHGGGVAGECGFGCASYAIYLAGSNNLVDGGNFYDVSGAGIQIYCNGSHANCEGRNPDGNIVRNTTIHDITRDGTPGEVWGILIAGSNTLIYNNLIYGINTGSGTSDAGIAVTQSNNKVWNNTIYNNTNTGIYVDTTASSTTVQNNIAYLSVGSNYVDLGTSTTHDHNLEGTNPVFVTSGATPDLHLQTTSPAKNAGTTLTAFTTDKDGITRPQGSAWDIGAYEFH